MPIRWCRHFFGAGPRSPYFTPTVVRGFAGVAGVLPGHDRGPGPPWFRYRRVSLMLCISSIYNVIIQVLLLKRCNSMFRTKIRKYRLFMQV